MAGEWIFQSFPPSALPSSFFYSPPPFPTPIPTRTTHPTLKLSKGRGSWLGNGFSNDGSSFYHSKNDNCRGKPSLFRHAGEMWCNGGVIVAWLWCDFGVIVKWLLRVFSRIVTWLRLDCGVIVAWLWSICGVIMTWLRHDSGVVVAWL